MNGLLSAISFKEKSGSKTLLIFIKSLISLDFCAIVEPLAPKCSAISDDDVLNRELLQNMKLMLQMVYTEAAAHISILPDCSGQERLRPSFCTSFVHSSAHSSSKCSLQKATASSITFTSLSFNCCLSISSTIKFVYNSFSKSSTGGRSFFSLSSISAEVLYVATPIGLS